LTAEQALKHKWLTSNVTAAAPAATKVYESDRSIIAQIVVDVVVVVVVVGEIEDWLGAKENAKGATRGEPGDETRRRHSARCLVAPLRYALNSKRLSTIANDTASIDDVSRVCLLLSRFATCRCQQFVGFTTSDDYIRFVVLLVRCLQMVVLKR
jgi:hypothetical protein